MKSKTVTILLAIGFTLGLTLLLYPTVSNYWNSIHQGRVVTDYNTIVATLSRQDYEQIFSDAQAYNESLLTNTDRFDIDETTDQTYYKSLLSINGSEVMGTLEIPKLNVKLPLYHGTSEAVLQEGIGHIEGSSLPIGGESTHSALSGHSGLPSAKLLTDLDQMEIGDMFYLYVCGKTLAYQVDQILIVDPDDVEPLAITPGEDYVTLITCTPYGINTHRLLVRGTRTDVEANRNMTLTNDASLVNVWLSVGMFALPIFLLCFIGVLVIKKRK
jgi:sortase A